MTLWGNVTFVLGVVVFLVGSIAKIAGGHSIAGIQPVGMWRFAVACLAISMVLVLMEIRDRSKG